MQVALRQSLKTGIIAGFFLWRGEILAYTQTRRSGGMLPQEILWSLRLFLKPSDSTQVRSYCILIYHTLQYVLVYKSGCFNNRDKLDSAVQISCDANRMVSLHTTIRMLCIALYLLSALKTHWVTRAALVNMELLRSSLDIGVSQSRISGLKSSIKALLSQHWLSHNHT